MFDPYNISRRKRLMKEIVSIPNLVGYYPISETSGSVIRNYAPVNKGVKNGTITDVTIASLGKVGRAGTFNGTSSRIAMGTPLITAQNNWTLFAIFYSEELPTTSGDGSTVADMIVYNGVDGGGTSNGMGFGIGGDNGVDGSKLIGLFGGVAYTNTSYTFSAAQAWYFGVMRRSAGTTRFFVNGADVGFAATDVPGIPTLNTTIGAQDRNSGISGFTKGKIQHVGLVNSALASNKILQLARVGGFA